MKLWFDVFGIVLGSLMMASAIGRAWRMRHTVQQAGYCTLLRTLIALMGLFLFGYLFSVWALLTGHARWLHSVVSLVFLFGSVFVLLTIWLAQSTSLKLREYSQHLERLVEERTQSLQEALREQERSRRHFAQLFNGLPVACFTYDRQGTICDWNTEAERLYGYTRAEAVGRTIYELFCHPDEVDLTRRVIEKVFSGETFRNLEWQDISKDGTVRWMLCSTFPLSDASGEVVGGISANIDITERKRQQQIIEQQRDELEAQNQMLQQTTSQLAEVNAQLEHLARTDALTGLPNHRLFRERLEREFLWAVERDLPLSLLLLDVDHFKHFNDTFGHQAGDEVLRKVAAVLRDHCKGTVFAARYGGEEFAVILPEMPVEVAVEFADELRQAIASVPCCYRQITASVGVSTADMNTLSPDSLIEEADRALYVSKREGRNRVTHAFAEGVRVVDIAPEEWDQRLQQAICDPGGYATKQVISQIIYDHLQALRQIRHALQGRAMVECTAQVSERLARWKGHIEHIVSSERQMALCSTYERFQALLDTLSQHPSDQKLRELLQVGEEVVASLQETLATLPNAA